MKFRKTAIWKNLSLLLYTVASILILFLCLHFIFPLPHAPEYSAIITDNKNEIIHAYLTRDEKWRMKTEADEISPLLKKTLIEKEDKYFYYHPGVNPLAILRAFTKNIISNRRTSGASTITMQVARALEPKKRNYFNKLTEIFRALQLEAAFSKDEILLMYLNLLPYGGNIEGVKAAALIYFKKSPDHLSLAEITALSIIPNRPSSLVIGKNNDLIVTERNRWLNYFAEQKLFTKKEIADALEEPLLASRGTLPSLLPHLSFQLKKNGGNLIRTTIDLNTQQKLEKLVYDYVQQLRYKNIRNAAVIAVDNKSGRVVSYIGSADFRDTTDGSQVNGAAAIRQPGSTLKPLLYALSVDEGLMTPKMVLTDVAVNYQGYTPENYDKRFNGFVTMEYALDHSLNIPAVKGLASVGKDKLVDKLSLCGFEQVKKDQHKLGLSMILGGCGTTLEELTGLFSCFANDGVYSRPSVLQDDKKDRKRRIISAPAAFMINEILSKVNRPDFPLNWQATEKMPKIAWKTGTSYGRRDAWSIGYNKSYTVGVWVGNFSGQGIPELSGANVATPLLFKIFNSIDYDSDEAWFTQPKNCEQRMVCSETGLVPADHCSNIIMDYFIPLVSSNRKCDNMAEVAVSPDGKVSYCKSCIPENGFTRKSFKMIPQEMQLYFQQNNISYHQLPAHNPYCEKIFREGAPVITFPSQHAEYLISRKNPEPLQLTCNVSTDVSKVYWYINNKFYKSAPVHSKQFFVPDEGPIKISCTDDKGRNKDIWITVRYVDL
jgi:penicillin-binding protein 1C